MRPARNSPTPAEARKIIVVNPLGGALHHYTLKLSETLRSAGLDVISRSVSEPSSDGSSSVRWLLRYFRLLVTARSHRGHSNRVLVTWPVLGHWDRIIVPVLTGDRRSQVVMHDPRPLVRALGYSESIKGLVDRFAPTSNLLVHSALAQEHLSESGIRSELVAHPIVATPHPRRVPGRCVVRVLGQWKPDRDLDLLVQLTALLPGVALEIVGRGWPSVSGWTVRDAFVSERELEELIDTSSAILIPYRRFYQSGIAARALESAVPVVGRRHELSAMTGADYPFLVSDAASTADWADSLNNAVRSEARVLDETRKRSAERASRAWERWGSR